MSLFRKIVLPAIAVGAMSSTAAVAESAVQPHGTTTRAVQSDRLKSDGDKATSDVNRDGPGTSDAMAAESRMGGPGYNAKSGGPSR